MSNNMPEIVRFRRSNDSRITTFSFPSKPLPHGFQMIFQDYSYEKFAASTTALGTTTTDNDDGSTTSRTRFQSNRNLGLVPERNSVTNSNTGSIELPFPRTLRDNTGTQVTAFERDFVVERLTAGLAGATGGQDIGQAMKNIGEMASQALSSALAYGKNAAQNGIGNAFAGAISDAMNVDTGKAMAIGSYLARKYLSGDLAKTAGAVTGRVVNPQQTLAFEGVNLREYSFEWDLFPANKADTDQITNIVNFLKSKMLPRTEGIGGVQGLDKAFLKYPSVVECSLLGVQEKHFMRFKRCMIDNVTVDYTGGGAKVGIIKGGVPASITLSISFKELSIQTADDYEQLLPPGVTTASAQTPNESDFQEVGNPVRPPTPPTGATGTGNA